MDTHLHTTNEAIKKYLCGKPSPDLGLYSVL